MSEVKARVEQVYREDSRRILATLIRLLGDFDLAEEALHEAFFVAVERWQRDGVPDNPRTWLVSTGRFKAIDVLRRRARFKASQPLLLAQLEELEQADWSGEEVEDDRLRLIFTCCHPALAADAQVPLTLREVCDLTTEEIARAFLSAPAAIAQRIVRAKAKIRDAKIPYQVPSLNELPERLDSVLRVIYLVFNEGYSASVGAELTREDLTREAIRLGRLLMELLPEPEVMGLLAMMLLHESRRSARTSPSGELVLLDDQDRSRWDAYLIAEGCALVERALTTRRFGPYCLQAAIAAVHAEAPSAADTDWAQIVGLYDVLLRAVPSPVIELNRAVAVAKRDGALNGLNLIEGILGRGELQDYHLAHSARAEFCRQLGRVEEARTAYLRALELTRQEPERRFIEGRLMALERPSPSPSPRVRGD
ncbi:RNA polymerase sigma factor [Pseudomonas fluorescens]|uniref:RNA polymerase subunit sigma-24 n=1 Tax=Pseudomonas fluorescens TaxID=294 RepID=A0A423M7G5_PSEFL|nr:RNA polymerase sigma factor [Pseudomonas fluorescens]RON78103.1 RNA polymerase subunit sigma-24 [Pseudomonas fluorescens]